MPDSPKSSLEDVLDKYDQDIKRAQEASLKAKTAEETFLSEFRKVRKDVIRPIMERIGSELKRRGHGYEILEPERKELEGKTLAVMITMNVYPKDIPRAEFEKNEFEKHPESVPHVAFSAVRYKRSVCVSSSNIMSGRGGSGGPSGEYDLSQVKPELVESELVKGLTHIFSRTYRTFNRFGRPT